MPSVLTHVDPLRGGLVRLAMLGEPRRFAAGDVLMRQGEESDTLFVVLTGKVQVERSYSELGEPVVLATLGGEEVLGEMGVLEGRPRSATVRAIEDTEVIEVAARAPVLGALLREAPEILASLLRIANRRLRETEESMRQALEELSRLKSEFISITSHELRTPMTTILGFSELLLEQTDESDPRRKFLTVIHEDSQQLARLVENLLDASRIENGWMKVSPEPLDLGEALVPLLKCLRVGSKRHEIELDVEPGIEPVLADPEKLSQVVTNLVTNAIKYSPEGRVVRVRVATGAGHGGVELSVQDEGIGIPPEERGRIFERFRRVDSAATRGIGGTGLGLYIVKHLAELQGGSMRVESTLGVGSTFTVTFPSSGASAVNTRTLLAA